ncbi:MAG: hypothetical protein JWN94_4032 [Betaproteobacteria bacterium]|nr:hypothetical protein [Betaproteobacteria bacterium]
MRSVLLGMVLLTLSGCAYLPPGLSQVQLTPRNSDTIYYGSVRLEGLAVVKLTVEIDRRIYAGNLEITRSNETLGLYERYGSRNAAPKTPAVLAATNFSKAVLSSTENRLLRCDFTDVGGTSAGGICIDDAQRLYDVIFS